MKHIKHALLLITLALLLIGCSKEKPECVKEVTATGFTLQCSHTSHTWMATGEIGDRFVFQSGRCTNRQTRFPMQLDAQPFMQLGVEAENELPEENR